MDMKSKKRNKEVLKTIRKTNYLEKSCKRTLLKLKNKDDGVLSLIADTKLYPNEYEQIHRLNVFSNKLKHVKYFDSFSEKINSLSDFEFNLARRFIFNSIKDNQHSHLLLSAILVSEGERTNRLIEYMHSNLFDRDTKDFCKMRFNLINYVLSLEPKDIASDSLQSFLFGKKNQIHLNNQFVFFHQ